jgi:hypothetical protein
MKTPQTNSTAIAGSSPVPCFASFVRMFKPQFADMVECGDKRQTVRPVPKRMPKTGDKISLRTWSGKPYRSKQRVLREAVISDVRTCQINDDALMVDGEWCDRWTMEWFAEMDGFECWDALAEWFRENHGKLPFCGIIIFWQNDKTLLP